MEGVKQNNTPDISYFPCHNKTDESKNGSKYFCVCLGMSNDVLDIDL